MIATAEKFADAGKLSLDTMTSVLDVAFDSSARLMALHLDTSRSLLQDGASHAAAVLDAKNTMDLFQHEAALGQSVIDSATACVRGAYEIVTQGQHTILQLMEPRIAEFNREITTVLDNAAKSLPAGSDLAFAAVMSALQVAKGTAGSGASAKDIPTEAQEEDGSRPARKTA